MDIQIVNPATGEVVATKGGLKLEASIPEHKTIPWWRVRSRYARKVLLRDLESVLSSLRDETRRV